MPDRKHLARHIFRQTLAAIDIPETMQRKLAYAGPEGGHVRKVASCIAVDDAIVDLVDYHQICAIAIGKASVLMAGGLVELLGPEAHVDGILVAPGDALPAGTAVPGFRV